MRRESPPVATDPSPAPDAIPLSARAPRVRRKRRKARKRNKSGGIRYPGKRHVLDGLLLEQSRVHRYLDIQICTYVDSCSAAGRKDGGLTSAHKTAAQNSPAPKREGPTLISDVWREGPHPDECGGTSPSDNASGVCCGGPTTRTRTRTRTRTTRTGGRAGRHGWAESGVPWSCAFVLAGSRGLPAVYVSGCLE